MEILIVKTGALGDIVRTTGLLPAIKARFPHAVVDWLVARNGVPLLLGNPLVRTIIADRLPTEYASRSRHYDWVICLEEDRSCVESLRVLRFERWSGCRMENDAVTYTPDTAEWFGMGLLRSSLDGGIARANELKKTNGRSYLELLCRGLGLNVQTARATVKFSGAWSRELQRNDAALWTRGAHRVVGINAGAGGRWPTKSLSRQMTIDLITVVSSTLGAKVALLGGAAELPDNQDIARCFPADAVFAIDTTRDLRLLMAAVALCEAIVTTDSLALHLALAVGTPVVALFGPTSGAEIDDNGTLSVVETMRSCGRCYLSRCPYSVPCMHALPIDHIAGQLQQQLARRVGSYTYQA